MALATIGTVAMVVEAGAGGAWAASVGHQPDTKGLPHGVWIAWQRGEAEVTSVPYTDELARAHRTRIAARTVAERASRAARMARRNGLTLSEVGALDLLADNAEAVLWEMEQQEADAIRAT